MELKKTLVKVFLALYSHYCDYLYLCLVFRISFSFPCLPETNPILTSFIYALNFSCRFFGKPLFLLFVITLILFIKYKIVPSIIKMSLSAYSFSPPSPISFLSSLLLSHTPPPPHILPFMVLPFLPLSLN